MKKIIYKATVSIELMIEVPDYTLKKLNIEEERKSKDEDLLNDISNDILLSVNDSTEVNIDIISTISAL